MQTMTMKECMHVLYRYPAFVNPKAKRRQTKAKAQWKGLSKREKKTRRTQSRVKVGAAKKPRREGSERRRRMERRSGLPKSREK